MKRSRKILIGCLIGIAALIFVFFVIIGLFFKFYPYFFKESDFIQSGIGIGETIGVLYIQGVIRGGSSSSTIFGGLSMGSDTIVRALNKAIRNDRIKAVLIRINSPGGSAAGAQEIYKEILRLREKKPVVISLSDVAASGGYYIASAGNFIIASPATLTGSIGVIMEILNYEKLFNKIGLNAIVLKSGKHKDIGSPLRELTKEERDILQNAINGIHKQFVKDISIGRRMPIEKVEKVADGRIFTGQQALELGFVDMLGNFQDAIQYAAKISGIYKEPKLENLYRRGSPFSWLFSSEMYKGSVSFSTNKYISLSDIMLVAPSLVNLIEN